MTVAVVMTVLCHHHRHDMMPFYMIDIGPLLFSAIGLREARSALQVGDVLIN